MNLGNSKIINLSRFSGGGNQKQFIIKTGNNKKVFIVLGFVMLLLWRTGFIANGQTVLVDPAGDGGFENGTTFSANGWTEVNDNTNYWVVGTDTYYSGNRSGYITNNGTTNNYDINTDQTSHFYRDITVPAGESKITLSFYIKGIGEAGYDRLLIYTAPTTVTPTAGTPTQWSTNFPGATLVYTQPNTISNYTLETIDLDPSFAGTTFRLIFTWQNDNNTGSPPPVSVDNIKVTSCAEVQANFTTSNTGIIPGTTLTFTDNSTGDPTSWSWTFAGGTPATSTLQNPVVTYNTTGTFDVSLTATNNCSSSDSETKTNYITVQDYCPSSGNMDYLDCVTLVNFNTINNSTGVKTAGYNDYTAQSTNVTIGSSYDLIVNLNTDGNYTNTAMVWIDWNHDGDFDDSGEEYDLGTANSVPDGASSNSPLSVTVPSGAIVGSTRMRVSTRYSSYPTSCQTGFDGEVEDYTVNICKPPDVPTVSFSANPICSGDDVTLLISGDLNSASQWVIDTGSCGGTQVGTTTSSSYTLNNVSSNTTYYVRGEGSCIAAGSCGSANVTVNPLPTATVTGSTTICTGSSADLTVTFTGTGPWDFDFTENGGAPITETNVTNNPETYTINPATTTTYEIVSVTDANCSNTVSSSATITVDPTSVGGTATPTSLSICPGTNTTISLAGYTGTIQWQQSADGTSGWANVTGGSGATTDSYTTANLAATTYYRAEVTSGTCSADYSNTVTITVEDTEDPTFTCPSATTATLDASCQLTIPDLLSGITNAADNCGTVTMSQSPVAGTVVASGEGTVHTVTITADDGNGNTASCNVNVTGDDVTNPATPTLTDITGECSATAPAPTTTDNCAGTITGTTSDPTTYSTQGTHVIHWTFDDGNGNSIGVNQNVIVNDVTDPTNTSCPNNITVNAALGSCDAVVTYSNPLFDDNCDGSGLTGTLVSGLASGSAFPVGTTTVSYNYTDDAGNGPAVCSFNVTVNSTTTASVSVSANNNPVCAGTSVTFTATPVNGGTSPTYQWKVNGNNVGTNSSSYSSSTLSSGDVVTVEMTSSISCATNNPATSNSTTITVDPTSVGGTAATDQTICSGETPANLTLTGETGSIQWQVSTDNSSFSDISGATATPLTGAQMGALTATTYYRAEVTSGSCAPAYSNSVTITVDPTSVGGTAATDQTICSGETPANITLTGETGSIQWQVSTDNSSFSDISGATATPLTGAQMGALATTTYYRAKVTSGSCAPAYSNSVTITVNPLPAITLNQNSAEVCSGDNTAPFGYTVVSGSPDLYSIDFDAAAEAEGFVDVTDATLSGNVINVTVPVAGTSGTYNAQLIVNNSSTSCISTVYNITIIINPLPNTGNIIPD